MGKRTIRKKRNSLRIKRSKNKKRSKTKILSKYSRKKLKKTKMRKRYGGTPRIIDSLHAKRITNEDMIKDWLKNKKHGIFSRRKSLSCIPPKYGSEGINMFLESKKIDAENYVIGLIDNGFTMYRLKVTPAVYKVLIMAKNNNFEVIPQTAEDTIDYRFSDFIKLKSQADSRVSIPALSLKAGNCYDRIMSINKLLSEISSAIKSLAPSLLPSPQKLPEQTLAPQRVQQEQTLAPQGVQQEQAKTLSPQGEPHVQTRGERSKNSLDDKTIVKIARGIRSLNWTTPGGPIDKIPKYDSLLKKKFEEYYEITEENKKLSYDAYEYAKASFLTENGLENSFSPLELYQFINSNDVSRENYVRKMGNYYKNFPYW